MTPNTGRQYLVGVGGLPARVQSPPGSFWGPFNLGGLVVITVISAACSFVCTLILLWLLLHYRSRLDEVLEKLQEYADKLAELGFDHGKLKQEHKTLKEDHQRGEELHTWLQQEIERKTRSIQASELRLSLANDKSAEDEKRISEVEKDLSSLRARYESVLMGLAKIARIVNKVE